MNGSTVHLASDRDKNLAFADQFEANFTARIDSYIEKRSLSFPEEMLPRLRFGFDQADRPQINLRDAGVSSVIWATGYSFDFSMVRLPIFDAYNFPIQQRGVTRFAGLYFVGLPWLHNAKSGLFFGLQEESEHIAAQIADRDQLKFPTGNGFVQWEASYEI